MRSIFAAFVAFFALTGVGANQHTAEHADGGGEVKATRSKFTTASARIPFRCEECFTGAQADESLILVLEIHPTDFSWVDPEITFNSFPLGHVPYCGPERSQSKSPSRLVTALDTAQFVHSLEISFCRFESKFDLRSEYESSLQFNINSVDARRLARPVEFVARMTPTSELIIDFGFESVDFSESEPDSSFDGIYDDTDSDLDGHLEQLGLLQAQADSLRQEIAAKVTLHRDQLCLKHLVKECDGVVNAAKAVAQRICKSLGIKTQAVWGYDKLTKQSPHRMHGTQGIMSAKDSGVRPQSMPFDFVDHNPAGPIIRLLQCLAALLGITTLWVFIRRKCMSIRTRTERAADREERQNARAYKRAARRALMHKRWSSFVNAINCFKYQAEAKIEDYEEKRALILQDAFLEQDLDLAEKGEIMEAEIRELRHAHEIVSSLVRVDEHRYDLVTPMNDPPPPLIPLPSTPRASRSRASTTYATSTYTLPSYTSESLPDYTSGRPSIDRRRSSGQGVYLPPTSDGDATCRPPPSESSGRTRYTPTSSVLDMSPRPSAETLRTRQSGDSR